MPLPTALTSFKDTLKPGVTVEQVRAARDQVVKTYDDLVKAARDAAKDRVDAVKAAQAEVQLPPSTTFPTTPP